MRLTTVLLIATMMQVCAASYAQKISLKEKNAPLEKIFNQIRLQSGYDFLFNRNLLKNAKPVDIDIKDALLDEVLKLCFANQPFTYTLQEKTIVVKEKEPSLVDVIRSSGNVILNLFKDLKGRVTDEQGKPLPNASIRIKGKSDVTNTDANGVFEIKNVANDAIVQVSYVGYKSLEISLKEAVTPLEIKLNAATGELEEVKVVYNTGYQELNKERATGSFVQIDNDLFNRRVGANVLDRISDLVPGLLRVGKDLPNALDDISIRGASTLNGNKRPLLVVDNFIYNGDPNKLNPNDIESVTILKDAAAASIWGARAGNGVIVLTTKKGKVNSAPVIAFNTNLTIGEKPDLFSLPIVPSLGVIALERKRFDAGYYDYSLSNKTSYPALPQIVEILARQRAGAINTDEANKQISVYEQHDVRNDINKYLLQTSIERQYALNISGGAPNYQYYGSVGYNRSRPNKIHSTNDVLTLGFNNIWIPIKGLQINAQLNWTKSTNQSSNSNGSLGQLFKNPYDLLVDPDGNALAIPNLYRMTYVDTVNFPGKLDWHYRPLDEAKNGNNLVTEYSTSINSRINYTIIQGLKVNIGYNWIQGLSDNTRIQDVNTFFVRNRINQYTYKDANGLPAYPYPLGGIYSQINSDLTSWTISTGLNFNRVIGKHDISSIIGVERNEITSKRISQPDQFGYNSETNVFSLPKYGNWTVRPSGSSAIGPSSSNLGGTLNRFGSYYGNIGYAYNQKYIATASARIDESNFFGVEANDRKKPLWSAGIKWNIANENFYKFRYLPILSLRATYGYAGNVNAGSSPYVTADYYSAEDPLYLPYAVIATPPNPELRWESVRTINLGLDFGIENNILWGSIELFHKKATDLISPVTVDPTSGFKLYTGNSSSVQTKGIELLLTTKNVNNLFKWNSTLNFAFQKDKVIAYTVQPSKFATTEGIFIGKPQSSIYSYRWAGLNPLNGDAQFYKTDQIVGSLSLYDGVLQEDLVYSGQTSPPVFGSFRNDFNFKNISLSVNINYQFGYYFRRASFDGSFTEVTGSWKHEDYLRAWKMPGDELSTNIPGFLDFYEDARYEVFRESDILIEKGDHIRLQDIRLGYNLNRNSIKKLPFKNASFYIYANNLGILWKSSKYNPDTKNDVNTTLLPKTIALGLTIGF